MFAGKTESKVALALAALGAAGIIACTPTETLSPAPEANQPAGHQNVAVDGVSGVQATVETNAWEADPTIEEQLTPLHLRIDNNSTEPVRVRYQEFALIGPDGQYYSALPPLAAQVDMPDSPTKDQLEPVERPSFRHDRFFVAPPYHYAYSTLPAWRRDFHHDPFYHRTYHSAYRQLDVSTAELRAWALPEGVIEVGGSVSGYLFFERVDPELERVRLRADLVNADNGRALGSLSIPFIVKKE